MEQSCSSGVIWWRCRRLPYS